MKKVTKNSIVSFILLIFTGAGCSPVPNTDVVQTASIKNEIDCVCCGKIVPDQTLFWALVNKGVSPKIVESLKKPLSKVLDMRKIYPGDRYKLVYNSSNRIKSFELVRSPWEKYVVHQADNELVAEKDTIALKKTIVSAKGIVHNTLWGSMRKAGIEPAAIVNFTDVLEYDFDFVSDTRQGHKFEIVYEKNSFGDSVISVGKILLARYETPDTVHTAVWYTDPDGREGYFDLKGNSMRKSMLKTPLTYRRISSHFSYRRFHPVLKIYRPHLGVDYAAPIGTPVVSSGDGVVVVAGRGVDIGNYIKIKHPNGIETIYGHLLKFARGIKKGVKVKRGQLIAYVGSTGYSTGPHLFYRIKVNGKSVNPEKYAFPAEPPIAKKYRNSYVEYARSVIEGAEILANDNLQYTNINEKNGKKTNE